jgi:hypothetical protein
MKWSRVQLVLSILTAAGLWRTARERIAFARAADDVCPRDDESPRSTALPSQYDVAGALHVHSTYSDGTGTVAQIAHAAAAAGVDFVLLTDHSTLAATTNKEDGWHENGKVLIVVGTEISTDTGHLLLLDLPEDFDVAPSSATDLMRDAIARGGFGYIALPCDLKDHWRDFNKRADGFGLEVFNLSSIARTKINLPGFLLALRRYAGSRPVSAFSYVAGRPIAELKLWDRLCREAFRAGRPIPSAIGCLDAHAVMRIGGREYFYPTYEQVFRTLRTHVVISEPLRRDPGDAKRDIDAITTALRLGRSFISYDNYGNAHGFSFEIRNEKECVAIMGDSHQLDRRCPEFIDVRAPDRRSIIRLLRDGEIVRTVRGDRLRTPLRMPGVYRVEVDNYRRRIGSVCFGVHPWIFSNPIDVRAAD